MDVKNEKKSGVLSQIIVAVVVALIAGSTSPWWWYVIFPETKPAPPVSSPAIPSQSPAQNPVSQTSSNNNVSPSSDVKNYLMDNQPDRVIIVTHRYNSEYRIEEPSSPWPWQGTATLDGGQLSGEAQFRNSLATMRVEGVVRKDGSIVIQYIFKTDDSGKQSGGRIDNHVWYPGN